MEEVYIILKENGTLYAKEIFIRKWIYTLPIIGLKNYNTIKAIKNYYHYSPRFSFFLKNILKKIGFILKKFNNPPYTPIFQKTIDFEKAYNFSVYKLLEKTNATIWNELLAVKK